MQHIKAIIWDFDGVQYPLNETIKYLFRNQAVNIAKDYIPDIGVKDAERLARKSYKKHHSHYDFIAHDYGVDYKSLTQQFYSGLDFSFLPPVSPDYLQSMADCNVIHGVLTHSDASHFQRVANHINVHQAFDPRFIATIEDIYPYKKSKDIKAYEYMINKIGCNSEDVIMVEDSGKNLKYAKELGLQTVQVYSQEQQKITDHIDYNFDTPMHFLTAFKEARDNGWDRMKLAA